MGLPQDVWTILHFLHSFLCISRTAGGLPPCPSVHILQRPHEAGAGPTAHRGTRSSNGDCAAVRDWRRKAAERYGCGILFTRVAPACRTAVNRHRSRDTTGYMPQAETSPRIRAEGSHPSCGTNCAKRVLKREKLSSFVDRTLRAGERTQRGRQYAAVVQRQYTSLPNWERGFDSRLWLHQNVNRERWRNGT